MVIGIRASALMFYYALLFLIGSQMLFAAELPLTVALFIKAEDPKGNLSKQKHYKRYTTIMANALSSEITGNFTVIDKDDVINAFKKEKTKSREEVNPSNSKAIEQKASALRICQMLGANYLLVCKIDDYDINNIVATVYDNKINDLVITMDVSVKINDGRQGGTVCAKTIRITKRIRGDEDTKYSKAEKRQYLVALAKEAGVKVGRYFQANVKKIANIQVDVDRAVSYSIKTNAKDVSFELDGVVIGTAPGQFNIPPGLHTIRLTKDGYRTFERMVNVFERGNLNINLERSAAGMVRLKENANIDYTQKQREAKVNAYKKSIEAKIRRADALTGNINAKNDAIKTIAKSTAKRIESDAAARKRLAEGVVKRQEAEGEASKIRAKAEQEYGPKDINVNITNEN